MFRYYYYPNIILDLPYSPLPLFIILPLSSQISPLVTVTPTLTPTTVVHSHPVPFLMWPKFQHLPSFERSGQSQCTNRLGLQLLQSCPSAFWNYCIVFLPNDCKLWPHHKDRTLLINSDIAQQPTSILQGPEADAPQLDQWASHFSS
jgi:hypothetical protein